MRSRRKLSQPPPGMSLSSNVPAGSYQTNASALQSGDYRTVAAARSHHAKLVRPSAATVAPGPVLPPPEGRVNFALSANGGVATASSTYYSSPWLFTPAGANNGVRSGAGWGQGEGWNDNAPGYSFPDWLQVDFSGSKTIDEIDVFTEQDN